jgi:hypothetical protein
MCCAFWVYNITISTQRRNQTVSDLNSRRDKSERPQHQRYATKEKKLYTSADEKVRSSTQTGREATAKGCCKYIQKKVRMKLCDVLCAPNVDLVFGGCGSIRMDIFCSEVSMFWSGCDAVSSQRRWVTAGSGGIRAVSVSKS